MRNKKMVEMKKAVYNRFSILSFKSIIFPPQSLPKALFNSFIKLSKNLAKNLFINQRLILLLIGRVSITLFMTQSFLIIPSFSLLQILSAFCTLSTNESQKSSHTFLFFNRSFTINI